MKFYTLDWWRGGQRGEHNDPTPQYLRHLEEIGDELPAALLALQRSISLHDARVRQQHFESASGVLELGLDGDDGTGGLRHFRLRYSDVVSFQLTVDPGGGLPGPLGLGDLGYDEADVAKDNFEHRLLFSSGIEFQIVFRGFELSWQDAVNT